MTKYPVARNHHIVTKDQTTTNPTTIPIDMFLSFNGEGGREKSEKTIYFTTTRDGELRTEI